MRLLPSKRAHLYVLERARVLTRDGRVEYISDEGREPQGFNIPVANTSFLLLGPGTSITNEAMRLLKAEGVCVGFCGTGGTPLYAAQDPFPDFLLPADEYREPGYLHRWIGIWSDEGRRLAAAKHLLSARVEQIDRCWRSVDYGLPLCEPPGPRDRKRMMDAIGRATSTQELLGIEGDYTKRLYTLMVQAFGFDDFKRAPRSAKRGTDPNALLDHGNYLAYGLASVVLWTLGIPASLAVLHGKTRRGGLVFDLADVVKDAVILPMAFTTAARARKESVSQADFRAGCITAFDDAGVLNVLFDTVTATIEQT